MTRNHGTVIDNARIRFGEGHYLEKFQLNPNHSKIYIPQDGKDYAVVTVGRDANFCVSTTEIPVNFKAEENGVYTLTVSATPHSSLLTPHLIDNLTGADIDLLANPSYTFEAKTTDYANRFKLVFATGNNETDDDFAYISNGELIVTGEGILQIFDVLGHQLFSQELSTPHSSLLTPHSSLLTLPACMSSN